jgi:hypothetical protein
VSTAAWRPALVGAVASLPVTALLRWLPNADADVAGGMMIVGAFVAGALATRRAVDPAAAGLRAGLLAGLVGLFEPVVGSDGLAIGGVLSWPSPLAVAAAAVLVPALAALFGLIFGRLGGWLATRIGSS